VKKFIQRANEMFKISLEHNDNSKYPGENIHELAIKSIMNISHNAQKSMIEDDDVPLEDLLNNISALYKDFNKLAKQYALRLVTLITMKWPPKSMQKYIDQIANILSTFIENCNQEVEIRLVILNLQKISQTKHLMISLAKSKPIQMFITNIRDFLEKHYDKEDFMLSAQDLLLFCKKISQLAQVPSYIVDCNMPEIALKYIKNKEEKIDFDNIDDSKLQEYLKNVLTVMKLLKNLFDSQD
jgi:hypothetical protein